MTITIHDANLRKIGWIDNEKQDTLNFYDDLWIRDLATGSSTFEFTVTKKVLKTDSSKEKLYEALNERAFVSFEHNGKTYLFNVMEVEETEKNIKCFCETLNLELLNEIAQPYESKTPKTFVEYATAMDLLNYTLLTVGLNEIKTKKLALSFSSDETKLARLLNLVAQFGAEIEFETQLKPNSQLKSFKINIYHGHDSTHHGVGSKRSDLVLRYGKNLKSITRKVSKKNLYTVIYPVGKRSDSTKNRKTTVTNPDGTQTITDKVAQPDGNYTVTTTKVDKSGKVLSTKKVVATKQSDGSIKKSTSTNVSGSVSTTSSNTNTVKNKDGSTTATTTVTKSDGTVEKTIVHTKITKLANKTTITVVTTTKPDGSVVERTTTKYANGSKNTQTKVLKAATKKNTTSVSKVDSSNDSEFDLSGLKDWKKTNAKGELEFYKRGTGIFANLAKDLYPSTFTSKDASDQWIRIDKEFEADSEEELNALALEYLESVCYPEITYEINGSIAGEIGDSVWIEDDGFSKVFQATARISRQEISQSNPSRNKTVVTNVNVVKSMLSDGITARLNELAEAAQPYDIRLETNNGTAFKNGEGSSTVIATLLKGAFEVNDNVSFEWLMNSSSQTSSSYTVSANDVAGTAQLEVIAYVGVEEVARRSLTFTDVTDGKTGAGVKSVKTLNKLSATNTANKDGTFAEAKPNPTKAEPYVVSYTKTELTDGTTIETPAIVTEVRNPEFDDLGKKITDVKSQVDDAKQDHDRQVAEIRAQATDATSLASQAQQIGNQAKADAANAYRTAAQAKTDAIEEATRLNTALAGRVETVEQIANGTKTTVSNLSKTVNEQGQSISTLTTKTNEVRTLADGTKRTVDSLSTTVGSHGTSIDNINKKTKTIEDGLSGIAEKYENLQVGIRNILKGTRDLSGNNSKNFNTSDKYGDFNIARSRPTTGYNDTFSATTEPLTNTEYIISFFAKSDVNDATCVCHFYTPNTTTYVETSTGYIKDIKPDGYAVVKLSTEWKRYWVKYKQSVSTPPSAKQVIVGRNNTADGIKSIEIAGVAMYEGHATKEYFDAPEDSKSVLDNIAHEVAEYKRTNNEALTSLSKTVTDEQNRLTATKTEFKQTTDGLSTRITNTQGMIPTEIGGVNLLLNSDFERTNSQPAFTVNGKTFNKIATHWAGYNSGLTNHDKIYHAYVDDGAGRKNVMVFNESDGSRNWKSAQHTIESRLVGIETDKLILSLDVFATGTGTKLFGGLHYCMKGDTIPAFHSGQFTINITTINKWHRLYAKVPYNHTAVDLSKAVRLYIYGYGFTTNSIVYIDNVKLETGDLPSAHSLAPEEYVTETKFHEVEDTVKAHKRTIGDGTAISQAIQDATSFKRSISQGGELYSTIETVKGHTAKFTTQESKLNSLTTQVTTISDGLKNTVAKTTYTEDQKQFQKLKTDVSTNAGAISTNLTKINEANAKIDAGTNLNLFGLDITKYQKTVSNTRNITVTNDGWIEVTIEKTWSGFEWKYGEDLDPTNKTYTLSYEAYLVDTTATSARLESDFGTPNQAITINKKPTRYVQTLNKPTMFANQLNFRLGINEPGKKWRIRNIKIEEGTTATPYIPPFLTITDAHAIKDTVSEHTRSINSINDGALKKTDVSITSEGLVIKTGKTVNGETLASMIAIKPEYAEIINRLTKVKGDMIVDGSITANKLNINNLQAITSDLGHITGGRVVLTKHHPQTTGYLYTKKDKTSPDGGVYDIAPMNQYTIPAYDTTLYLDDNGIVLYGDVFKTAESKPVTSYILTTLRDNGIYFTIDAETQTRDKKLMSGGLSSKIIDEDMDIQLSASGYLNLVGKNYIEGRISGKDIYYVRAGNIITVWFDVTSNVTGTFYLCNLPPEVRPRRGSQELVAEWDTGGLKRIQVDTQGNLNILSANKGKRYSTTITLIGK